MYLEEIGVALWNTSQPVNGPFFLKDLHCEAQVMVVLGGIGCNLHLTST